MATRVTLPASRFAPVQEARHGQPSVIADVRSDDMPLSIEESLALGHEIDCVDFKREFDPTSNPQWLELLKDIVAMANSGGGIILLGLDDDGLPSSGDVSHLFELDPADITNKIYKYTDHQFHDFQFIEASKRDITICALVVGPAPIPIIFTKPGTYSIENNRQKTAFSAGTVYFRHGAKSEPGCTDDLRSSFERLLSFTKSSWLDGIAKIVEAPAGARIAVLPPEIRQSDSPQAVPIRIVDDPTASPYFALKVDDTHPHRGKEVIALVNQRLSPHKSITSHTIVCIRRVHQIQKDIRLCYTMNYSAPRYSNDFVEWIVAQYEKNSSFFEEVKLAYDRLKTENT